MIYFDHNASTPLLPEARRAWIEASERHFGNPSSPHRLGARADAALDDARQKLASTLGCDASDIIWTSGATESNNTALHHFARALEADSEILLTAIEHPCLIAAAQTFFPNRHRFIPVSPDGAVDLDWLERELRKKRPGLVAIMAANNETGVLQPWPEALELCRDKQVPFLCDAAQWIGKLPAKGLGQCDLISGAAHKFGGPKGVGFLKCPSNGRFHPLLQGGPQEEERRAGTENVPGVLSMMAALEKRESCLGTTDLERGAGSLECYLSPKPVQLRLQWRQVFENRMLAALPGLKIAGASKTRLWNTVCAVMPKVDCRRRWVVKLDKNGFAVSTGSACASGREKPSHVLKAMGFSAAKAGRVVRFSSGWETDDEEWQLLIECLKRVYGEMPTKLPMHRLPALAQ
jgi:cysteine desulfurase